VRRSAILALAALVAAGALSVAATAANPTAGLPPGWSHATVNVVIRHQVHTLVFDRGRVIAVTPTSLTLRESDGTMPTIAVAPDAKVVIAGRPATLAQVRRFEIATTMSIDGAPATTVKVRIPPAVAAALARGSGAGR
jgi:hypothetical protein